MEVEKRKHANGSIKKKRKRDVPIVEGAVARQADISNHLSDAAKKEKKRLKKEKRRLAEEVASAAAAVPVTMIGDAEPKPRKEKKSKKKKKEKEGLAANGFSNASLAAQTAPQEEPAKKKAKKGGEAVGVRSSVLPAVGDREAAKHGPRINKQLYREAADVAAWPAAEVDAWRAQRGMVVEGADIKPITRFDQGGFSANMLQATRSFTAPSPIQAQCWPIVMSGRDLVGIAATGSGKTLAFGLPALCHLLAQRQAGHYAGRVPGCLVVAPTRELACQIEEVLKEAAGPCGLRTLTTYGGVPKKEQVRELKRGVDIIVATPGRLRDLLNDGACALSSVTYLVLDEADRMLDLGFEPEIRALAGCTRADRQTLMFSATWPPAIRRLAADFLADPARVTIGSQDISASHSVTQVVEVIEPNARDARLLQLMKKYQAGKTERILVFVLYKKEAPRVESLLLRAGFKAAAVHGDISQGQRTQAVEGFKDGSVPVLVATDVAARGLDIPDVAAVINYSFPLTIEDYVHRIGRTGRAGKTGTAHTFFSGVSDKPRAGELMNVLREAGQPVPPDLLRFGSTVKKKESKLYGAHFKDVDLSRKAVKVTFDSDDE